MGQFQRIDLKKHFHMVQDYNNFIDLLLGMMRYIPEQRLTAKEAKNHPFFDSIKKSHDIRWCKSHSIIKNFIYFDKFVKFEDDIILNKIVCKILQYIKIY